MVKIKKKVANGHASFKFTVASASRQFGKTENSKEIFARS